MSKIHAVCLLLLIGAWANPVFFHDFKKLEKLSADWDETHPSVDPSKVNGKVTRGPLGDSDFISGYTPISEKSKAQMYWLFYPALYTNAANQSDAPVIIWLEAGPGGSGFINDFMGAGRNSLDNATGEINEVRRPGSWNEKYSLLYFDQPVGTGYSVIDKWSDVPRNPTENAAHLYYVLTQILNGPLSAFAGSSFYIFGENYSGKWNSALGRYILEKNSQGASLQINLKGVGLGTPWFDPVNQMYFASWGYNLGILNQDERRLCEANQINAVRFKDVNPVNAFAYYAAAVGNLRDYSGGQGINPFNFQTFGDFLWGEILIDYLQRSDVKAKYGAHPDIVYSDVNLKIFFYFGSNYMQSQADDLAYIVERIPVLVYQGQDAVIALPEATSIALDKLKWSHQKEFAATEFQQWATADNATIYGMNKTFGHLTYALVNKAGTYTARDQIYSTRAMLDAWIPTTLGEEIVSN